MTSLHRHLLRLFVPGALVPLLCFCLWLSWDLGQRRRAALYEDLRERTSIARRLLQENPGNEAALLRAMAGGRGLRFTLVRADGVVVADTVEDPARMENHASRPEVAAALATGEGGSERHSRTVGEPELYQAMSLDRDGKRWGVIRAAYPLRTLREEQRRLWTLLALTFIAVVGIAIIIASRLSRSLSEPLDAISRAAQQVQEGKWTVIPSLSGPERMQQLTRDVNAMVERLQLLVQEKEAGRVQLETIVGQMHDGLLVLDREGYVVRANPAAVQFLDLDAPLAARRPLLEVVQSYPLDAVARHALAGEQPEPVELRSPRTENALRVLASPLRLEGKTDGAILLIQDLTEIRRVDQVRRDFVANVGHELKTPIAALRALAETIVLRGERRPEIAVQYARRMSEEVERLGTLVEDLLDLSRIESGKREVRLEEFDPASLVTQVVARYAEAAAARNVRLALETLEPGMVRADREALFTVLSNIVDNAVKYTLPGGEVRVSAYPNGREMRFTVADSGVGIPAEDLPRVFERFYRVDRARSQEIEGTGLGLAIVKHLCESQGGKIWVESELGRGSRFHLSLPLGAPAAAGVRRGG